MNPREFHIVSVVAFVVLLWTWCAQCGHNAAKDEAPVGVSI